MGEAFGPCFEACVLKPLAHQVEEAKLHWLYNYNASMACLALPGKGSNMSKLSKHVLNNCGPLFSSTTIYVLYIISCSEDKPAKGNVSGRIYMHINFLLYSYTIYVYTSKRLLIVLSVERKFVVLRGEDDAIVMGCRQPSQFRPTRKEACNVGSLLVSPLLQGRTGKQVQNPNATDRCAWEERESFFAAVQSFSAHTTSVKKIYIASAVGPLVTS